MSKKSNSELTIREMLDKFEQIVADFDSENLDVEAAIEQYEKGAKLAEEIRVRLETEKNKIKIVREKMTD